MGSKAFVSARNWTPEQKLDSALQILIGEATPEQLEAISNVHRSNHQGWARAVRRVCLRELSGPPGVVWHYCPASTAVKILESGSIRLGSPSWMNDESELEWGLEIAAKAHREVTGDPLPDLGGLRKPLASCLSSERDSLTMWRLYGDDGEGCVVGLSTSRLLELGVSLDLPRMSGEISGRFGLHLLGLIYEREDQETLAHEMMQRAFELRGLIGRESQPEDTVENWLRSLSDYVYAMVIGFKSHYFSDEREWRLVFGHGQLAPGTKLTPEKKVRGEPCRTLQVAGAICSVGIGPTSGQAVEDVRQICSGDLYPQDIKIWRSRAPYRERRST